VIRGRAGGFVGFAFLGGLVGAVVLAGVAGARRTEQAFDDMVVRYRAPDIAVFIDPSAGEEVLEEVNRRLDGLEVVGRHGGVATAIVAIEDPDDPGTWHGELGFSATDEHGFRDIERALVVRGRRADPNEPNEIVVDEAYAASRGLDVGGTLRLGLTPPEQLDAAGNGLPIDLELPPEEYEVVGVLRPPAGLAPRLVGVEGTIDASGTATLYLSAAFWAENADRVAGYGGGIVAQLRDPGGLDDVRAALGDLPVQVQVDRGNAGQFVPAIFRAVDVEARALLGASALLGVVAIVLLGQALRRQVLVSAREASVYRAMGFDRRGLAMSNAIEWAIGGALAAVVAVGVALALSPLAPIGIARRAGLSFGVHADVLVLLAGAVGIVLLFTVGGAALGWGASRRGAGGAAERRSSRLAAWLSSAGAPPSTVIGARMALEPGRGSTAVPVRSTVTSALLGIGAVCAAVTFSSSLERLVDEPVLRGWNWDHNVGNYSSPDSAADGRRAILDNPGVEAATGWLTDFVVLDGVEVSLLLLDPVEGVVGPEVREGRLPTGPGEIALAPATRSALDVDVGDEVEAIGPNGRPVDVVVVGESGGNGLLDSEASLDEGSVMTFEAAEVMIEGEEIELFAGGFLVRLADGQAGAEALAQLRQDFPGTVYGPSSTADIENLRRVQWLPRLIVVGVAALAFGTTAHALFSAVRRRRRDLAVLKTLGFRRRQLATVATAQAMTFAVIALLLGVPLGIAAGRALWDVAAEQIGTFAGPRVPVGQLLLGAAVALGSAVVLAVGPGRRAARTPAAQILRAE
jgi:hypothetical protein